MYHTGEMILQPTSTTEKICIHGTTLQRNLQAAAQKAGIQQEVDITGDLLHFLQA